MSYRSHHNPKTHLSDELDDTTGLLDLLLSESRDESGLDDERCVDSAFSELLSGLPLLIIG